MLTTISRKSILICFLVFFCTSHSFGQSEPNQQKTLYVYTLKFTDDFTPGNGKSKVYVIRLRKLFKEVNTHYVPASQTFVVKTETERKSVQEYTEIILNHGAVLTEPIKLEKIIIG